MRKSTLSVACALIVGALSGFLSAPAQAAPAKMPTNVQLLDQALAKVKPGQKYIFFGDMALPVARVRAFRNQQAGIQTRSAFYRTNYWTGGRVPYVFDTTTLDAEAQGWFLGAAREWEKYANLKFFPRTTEANYIRVYWDGKTQGAAFASVGMQGGEQVVMLGKGAGLWVTVHELGHSLGLMHEQSRSDRDKFITVNFENISPGLESQYAIVSDSDNHREYDFDSIMHYFDTAFSVDGVKKTMTAKPAYSQFQSLMGQQNHTSEKDRAGMADIYGFPPGVNPTPTPTPIPSDPTIVVEPVAVKEGTLGRGDGNTTQMVFHARLSAMPKKDVSFSYKIVRFIPSGMTANSADIDKYSANPGEDFVETTVATMTIPAATPNADGTFSNSSKEIEIPVTINRDSKIENDEPLMLVLSDLVNARFVNNAQTVGDKTISVKGTIQNDDPDSVPTTTATPKPTATPVAPLPTPIPEPTATPIPFPKVRVTITPSVPTKTDILTARVEASPRDTGITLDIVWRLNKAVVARNVTSVDLSKIRGPKRGSIVSVEVTPIRGKTRGTTASARVEIGNTPPVAKEARGTTRSAVPVSIPLGGTDADGDTVSFALASRPRNGSASVSQVNGRWTLVYRSKVGFVGDDVFSITAFDGKAKSIAATVRIRVEANASPQVVSVSPSSGTFQSGTTVSFTQVVSDSDNNVSTVGFLVSNSSRSADSRGGVALLYDATTRTVHMASDDGAQLSDPIRIGAALENARVKAVLRSVSTDGSGTMTLRWQLTFKAGWTGQKTLWARAEDTGTLNTGFRSMGKITLSASSTGSDTSANNS